MQNAALSGGARISTGATTFSVWQTEVVAEPPRSGKGYKMTVDYLTKIPGYPSKSDAVPGMAHFSGSGPSGTQCHSCFFYTSQHRSKRCGYCLKTQQLVGQRGAKIHGSNSSCRYYEEGGTR